MKFFNFHIITDKRYQYLVNRINELCTRNIEVHGQANITYANYENQIKLNEQLKATIAYLEGKNRHLLNQCNFMRKKLNKKPIK